jgi:hypothetical protein
MNLDSAIERWRVPLLGHVRDLFAELGLIEGRTVERVSKSVYRLVLGKLRRAEAAARRLIAVAARDIVLEPPPPRPERAKPKTEAAAKAEATVKIRRTRRPSFNLFDPLKRFERGYRRPAKRRGPEPRARYIDYDPRDTWFRLFGRPQAPAPAPEAEATVDDDTVDATKLVRRLLAIMDALQDILRQAMRLARWEARPKEERRPERWSSLRPGQPPGFRQRSLHELDDILKECHWLARRIYPPIDDTS